MTLMIVWQSEPVRRSLDYRLSNGEVAESPASFLKHPDGHLQMAVGVNRWTWDIAMVQASNQADTQAGKSQSGFDPYHKWLGIPPEEQPPNHYRLLGITLFESDQDVIDTAATKQLAYVRQCATGPHAEASQQVLNDLSTAQICLLNSDQKSTYDAKLKAELAAAAKRESSSPAGNSSETVSTGQRAVDPTLAQLTQKLDKQKKQIEKLLEKCEFAAAISALEKMAGVKHPKAAKYVKWAKQQLPKAKSGTDNMRESTAAMYRTATDLVDRNDFEEAAEILQQIPQKYRNQEISDLLQECLDLQEEIVVLQEDIERAESLNKYEDLQPTVERLLEIKPNDRRAKRLLKELKTYGKGGGMRLGGRGDQRFDVAGNTSNPLKVALFVVIPLMLFAAVGYATVVYVRSNNKTIKIEVDDPAAKVIIDGEEIEITGVGDTVKLRTGMHKLIVERGDLVVHTREFEVVKGKNPVLRISLESATVADTEGPAAPTSGTATSGSAPLPKPVLAVTFEEGADADLQMDNRGATFAPGKVGRALNCNGKGFVVVPANLPAGNSARTIAAWLNIAEETTNHNHHAIAYGREESSQKQFGIYHGQGHWAAYGAGVSLETDFQSGWHHHCVSFDGSEMVYRLDGKVVGKRKVTLNTTAGPLVLGNFADLGVYFRFQGLIDDVRIFDTALSDGQVGELLEKQGVTAGEVQESSDFVQVRLTGIIDGLDEVRISKNGADWKHREWGWPEQLKLNGKDWSPQAMQVYPNSGSTKFLPDGARFEDATVTIHQGRGGFYFEKNVDRVYLAFKDNARGAAPYDVTFRIPVGQSSPPAISQSGTASIRVNGEIDGNDEFRLYKGRSDWNHRSGGIPKQLKLNGKNWNLQQSLKVANTGGSRFMPESVRFLGAALTITEGRGPIFFQKHADHVYVNFNDDKRGADVYDVTVELPSGEANSDVTAAPADAATMQQRQLDAANRLGTSVEISNSIGMKFRLIPAGEFAMGSSQAEIDALLATAINVDFPKRFASEGPQRQITLTQPFFLGTYEVTQAEYQQVMGRNPAAFSARGASKRTVAGLDTRRFPIEQVNWFEAVDFCIKLSQNEGLRPCYSRVDDTVQILDGNGYRLPTEAEWEFACRAGTQTRWSFGDVPQDWTKHGWFPPNAEGRTHEVGELPPNQFGLHDMHGNVWEWCQDWHAYDAYDRETRTSDPVGPSQGTRRVLRGGSFIDKDPLWVRAAYRGYDLLGNRAAQFGFRIVKMATGGASKSASASNDSDAATIADPTTTFKGHSGLVRAVAVSPDGKLIASGGHDTVVRVWDVQTGKAIHTLEGHEDAIHDLEFSPDGQLLVTASGGKYENGALVNPDDMSIRTWNVATGQQIKRLVGHTKPIVAVSISPDSRQLASISHDKTVRLWDVESGTLSRQLADDVLSPMDIAYTPDGESLVVGDRYKNIHLWNVSTGEKLNRIPTQAVGVESIAVSPDGRHLLVGFHDGFAIRLFDIQTGDEIREFRGHGFPGGKGPAGYPSTITSLSFSKDGKRFVSCATDGTARVWDVETGKQGDKIAVHGKVGYVMSATFTPDGRHVVSAANDVFLYELLQ